MLPIIIILYCLLLSLVKGEIFFDLEIPLMEQNAKTNYLFTTTETKNPSQNNDIYDYHFYLDPLVRINATFTSSSTYGVLYLNYPITFTNQNPASNNKMKNLNSAGIIILSNQPANTNAENLSSQSQIKPFAYFTLQEIPLGWQIYTPADYYTGIAPNSEDVTALSLYNHNFYFGKKAGPIHTKSDFNRDSINVYIRSLGKYNIVIGNYTGNFIDNHLISYNNVIGTKSGGSLLTGSFNQVYGAYNISTDELNSYSLSKDYYSNNDYLNYNNIYGFGNLGTTTLTPQKGKFIANKQNNIVGNLNLRSTWYGMRNCILGNRIFMTVINDIQFNYVDSNILIGNDIAYFQNNASLNNIWKNIWLIPSGSYDSGGINMESVLTNNINESIMIGSCGGQNQYDRTGKTFIANIYNTQLIEFTDPKTGEASIPEAVFVGINDQLGNPTIRVYGDKNTATTQPGNIYNIDDIVINELLQLPIVGVAFKNTAEAAENGLLYTVDVNQIIANPDSPINRLSSFIVFNSKKEYLNNPGPHNSLVKREKTLYPKIAGYEHYFLIPLLIRALQLLSNSIFDFKSEYHKTITELLQQNNALIRHILSQENNPTTLEELLENNIKVLKALEQKTK